MTARGGLLAAPVLGLLLLAGGCASTPEPKPSAAAARAADHAAGMVGKPYRYGGNTPAAGFDCSGLVQWSYARAGVRLPHGTDSLRRLSRPVSANGLRRGDLLFFTQEGKRSSHVALYLGDERFVHAPSSGKRVYVARLSERYWREHLDEARRLELD